MKKQRILALTLAATTAMSMFAGMSVSAAADTTYGYQPYTLNATEFTSITAWDNNVLEKIDTSKHDTTGALKTGAIYLMNFKMDSGNTGDGAYSYSQVQTLVEDAQWYLENDAANVGDVTKPAGKAVSDALTALRKYYGTDPTPNQDNKDAYANMSSERITIISNYIAQWDAVDKADDNRSKYYAYDLDFYGFDNLVSAMIPKASAYTAGNSTLVHLTNEAKRILGAMEAVATVTDEESYNEKLEEVSALEADDYTAANFKAITRTIEDAEELAADGKYGDALSKLKEIDKIQTITPTTEAGALKKALDGLFTEGGYKDGIYSGNRNPDGTPKDDKCVYDKNDYDDIDAWRDFAGYGLVDTADDYVEGAYRAAIAVYNKYRNPTTRRTLAKSTVVAAQENLDAALLALDPNYTTPNWLTIKIEEALEAADKVVEDDYRTNTNLWKKFVAAKEALEKLLEQPAIKPANGESAIEALTAAQTALSTVKKPVPTATQNDLKTVKKEATTLLKKTDGKTLAQVTALQDALAAANKINSTKTISEYETAIADLEAAIANYNQLQGWYQENGVWYYGQGNGKATGWLHLGADWYWLDQTTGAMAANTWKEINGAWYYFYGSGKMVAGKWHQVNGTWYSFTNSGAMRKGWFKSPDNDNWYYLNPSSGAMVANGWYKINGKDYYFYANGSMAANTTIGGYTVGADGAWVK